MPLFDLKKNLIFYGAYHREPTNVKIHITFVPILLATGFFFGTNTPAIPTPSTLQPLLKPLLRASLPLNLCTLAGIAYSSTYLALSPNAAGFTISPLVLLTASLANKLHSLSATSAPGTFTSLAKLNGAAVAIHVVSWIVQFIGHGKFEGRKPALLDNLVQALLLAPLFVWYEILFKLGFYKGLKGEVERGVEVEVKKIEAKKE